MWHRANRGVVGTVWVFAVSMFKSEEEEMENRSWNDDILLVVGSIGRLSKGIENCIEGSHSVSICCAFKSDRSWGKSWKLWNWNDNILYVCRKQLTRRGRKTSSFFEHGVWVDPVCSKRVLNLCEYLGVMDGGNWNRIENWIQCWKWWKAAVRVYYCVGAQNGDNPIASTDTMLAKKYNRSVSIWNEEKMAIQFEWKR